MSPKQLLQTELARRCERNPRYSLRSFAKSLGISHTVLSLVLNGRRPLSKKAVFKVADALELDPVRRQSLLERRRIGGPDGSPLPTHDDEFRALSLDTFAIVSDWHHYAILSLLELPGARFEARWISARLGISRMQAKLAIERLARMGLVAPDAGGRWRQTGKPLRVESSVSTAATRKFHRQIIGKALDSLENDLGELRDFTSMTFTMDPALVPHAKERIRGFRRKLVRELESKGSPKRVYNFCLQLYPVSTAGSEE